MFKDVIFPIQAWLLSQKRCVGCGRDLSRGQVKNLADGTKKITCNCGRIFIYDPRTSKYRRALLEEV